LKNAPKSPYPTSLLFAILHYTVLTEAMKNHDTEAGHTALVGTGAHLWLDENKTKTQKY
jgi:hypothetical protein